MTISTETVRMAKSQPRKNQSERSDLPCHIIKFFIIFSDYDVTRSMSPYFILDYEVILFDDTIP